MEEKDLKNVKSFVDSISYDCKSIESFKDSFTDQGDKALKITVATTHGGYINCNYRFYRPEDMEEAVQTFTKPFRKPVYGGSHPGIFSDSKEIGRVTNAWFEKIKDAKEGEPTCRIVTDAIITDSDAIKKIKDGRYLTVSSGAYAVNPPVCSICGLQINDEDCQHYPGKTYEIKNEKTDKSEKKLCYVISDGLIYNEFSYVGQPADQSMNHFAGTISAEVVDMPDFTKDVKLQQDSVKENVENENINDEKIENIVEENLKESVEVDVTQDNKEEIENLKKELEDINLTLNVNKKEIAKMQEMISDKILDIATKDAEIKIKLEEIEKISKEKKEVEDYLAKVLDSYKNLMLDEIGELECQTNEELMSAIKSADSQEIKDKLVAEKVDTYRNLSLADIEKSLKDLKLKKPNKVTHLDNLKERPVVKKIKKESVVLSEAKRIWGIK